MGKRDYYDVIGVKREATADEIKKAYRKLARQYHPDLHPGDKKAEEQFKELQEAYDILSDQTKRDQYDRYGAAAFEQAGAGARGRTYSWRNEGGPEASFDFGEGSGFEEMLGGLFGGRKGRRARFADMPGQDIETELKVPFKTAVLGGEIDVVLGESDHLAIKIPPGVADGARLRLAGKGQPSPGNGRPGDLIVLVRVQSDPLFTRKGEDLYIDLPITISEAVLGAHVEVPTLDGGRVSLAVPPGASSGNKLRLRGKGAAGKNNATGDLYAVVKIVVPKGVDDESKRLIERFAQLNPQQPRRSFGG